MRYMLLIYGDENADVQLSDEERAALYERYRAFNEEARRRGAYVAADELQPTSTATTVRLRNGQVLTTDGPFAESKELVGGYAVYDVPSMDVAMDWAVRFANLHTEHWPGWEGEIEVRPIFG